MSDRITANAVLHPRPDLTCHVPRASRLRYSISEKCNEVPEGRRRDPHGSPNGRRKREAGIAPCVVGGARAEETGVRSSANRTLCPLSNLLSGERF